MTRRVDDSDPGCALIVFYALVAAGSFMALGAAVLLAVI